MNKNNSAKKLAYAVWLITAFAAISFVWIKIQNWGPILDMPEQSDFGTYYYSGKISTLQPDLLYKHQLWEEVLGGQYRSQLPYLYLPVFSVFMQPISSLPYSTAQRVWFWCSISAIIVTLIVMKLTITSNKIFVLFAILWLFSPSTLDTLFLGQVNTLLAMLLTLACIGIRNKSHTIELIAGACLGIVSAVKPFPIGLILYAFIRRRYWYVVGTIFSICLLFTAGLILLPISVTKDYFSIILGVSAVSAPPGIPIFWNQSVAAFWRKLSIPVDVMLYSSPTTNPIWVTIFIGISNLILFGYVVKVLLPQRKFQKHQFTIHEVSLVLIMMMLLTPITWWHYLLITTFIYYSLATILYTDSTRWWQQLAISIGYLFTVIQRAMERIIPIIRIKFLSSLMFFGLLIWYYVTLFTLMDNRTSNNAYRDEGLVS
jgi:hypothetical protein